MRRQISSRRSAPQRVYKMLSAKRKRHIVRTIVIIAAICLFGMVCALGISEYVHLSQMNKVVEASLVPEDKGVDCVVVLGAGLKADGTPNHMLEDRIKVGVEVLTRTGAEYILMSGDHSDLYYDEPGAMKKYAEGLGVDPAKILIDNNGLSTYESITRVKSEFGFDNIVIVTQEYHVYRALYIAEHCDIEAIGVGANLRSYRNQVVYSLREIAARVKDFIWCI